jgi:hypothetical protein
MSNQIRIQPLQTANVEFRIRGTAPILQHAWSKKALKMLAMTAAERRKMVKEARDPEGEATGGLYMTEDGQFGIPAMAVKSAMISAAHKDFGVAKTDCRKALRFGTAGVIPFDHYSDYRIREDIVRVGQGATDIRYRCEFAEWGTKVQLLLATDILNTSEVVNLANRAGFLVGICEWRPECGGEMGTFEVDPEFGIKVK